MSSKKQAQSLPSNKTEQKLGLSGHYRAIGIKAVAAAIAENVTSAVEEAKRHYEQLRRVPIWSLCADRLELESEGKRTSHRPTHHEFALIPIPGRRKAVSEFAIG